MVLMILILFGVAVSQLIRQLSVIETAHSYHDNFHPMLCFLIFQIRTLGMLRSRFRPLPGAFNGLLIPCELSEASKKKSLLASLSSKSEEV